MPHVLGLDFGLSAALASLEAARCVLHQFSKPEESSTSYLSRPRFKWEAALLHPRAVIGTKSRRRTSWAAAHRQQVASNRRVLLLMSSSARSDCCAERQLRFA